MGIPQTTASGDGVRPSPSLFLVLRAKQVQIVSIFHLDSLICTVKFPSPETQPCQVYLLERMQAEQLPRVQELGSSWV